MSNENEIVTVLEFYRKEAITYEMPRWLMESIARGIELRFMPKSWSGAIRCLPIEVRELIKEVRREPTKPEVKGHEPSFIFYDEMPSGDLYERLLQHLKELKQE